MWEAHEIDTVKFKASFSQRRKDIFQQQGHEEVSKNSQCAIYCKFKELFNMENSWKIMKTATNLTSPDFGRAQTTYL